MIFSHTRSVLTPGKTDKLLPVISKFTPIPLRDLGDVRYAGSGAGLSYRLMVRDSQALSLAAVLKGGSIKYVSLRKQTGRAVPMSSILHTPTGLDH